MRDKLSLSSIPLRRKGLTLMELLIVIGIIAVLAGIIWVVFGSIRGRVREVTCSINLRNLFLALQAYREDWDGIDPDKGQTLQCYEVGFIPYCLPVVIENLRGFS